MLNVNDMTISSKMATRFMVRSASHVRVAFGEQFDPSTVNYHTAVSMSREDAGELIAVLTRTLAESEPSPPNRQQRRVERAGKKA
jgi:hypothetical protein